jgi:cytochrome b subunit of formate dehydrogenase
MVFRRGLLSAGRFLILAVLSAVVCILPAFSQTQDNNSCAGCHDQGQKLRASAHASVGCAHCHLNHDTYPHPEGVPKPACSRCHPAQVGEHAQSVHGLALKRGNAAAPDCAVCHGSAHELAATHTEAFRKKVPETCGMCHTDISQQFLSSVHGKALELGVAQAPVCTDCHGEHSIQAPTNRASLVNPSNVPETCARCHGNVRLTSRFGMPADRVVSFEASYHGLASAAGSQTVANCASCHGVHNILASSDPQSTINPKNLPRTCGRCHPGAGTRYALGPVHLWAGRAEPVSVRLVRQTYLVLIPLVIGLMLLHNLGDWIRKFRKLRWSATPQPEQLHRTYHQPLRVLPFERILHGLLLVSFVVLAWTGFQLKYPEQWWAKPMLSWEARWSVRGMVHRSAAVVFILTAMLHLFSLIVNPQLRRHWKNLWPRYTDVAEAWQSFTYNLGLSSRKPCLSPYSFLEKAEYWALVWGGVIMGFSGLVLWADNLTLRLFPKEVLDFATAVHFYEAVLACLAIVVWHFYLVIFDPDVYPLDTSFLNGKGVREHGPAPAPDVPRAGRW